VTRPLPPARTARSRRSLALALVLAGGALAAVSACNRPPAQDPEGNAVTALFDVQPEATAAFKTALGQQFPATANADTVEAGLSAEGFECGPDPTDITERACVREVAEGACTLISIVRSAPFLPEGAQVVRACPQGAGTEAGASPGGAR
jgi:hypothetical protein